MQISDPGDYEVEHTVTKRLLFLTRTGVSRNTFRVERSPSPEVQIRTMPFAFKGGSSERRTQTFVAGTGEKIIDTSLQINFSNNAEARIVSQTVHQVDVEVILNPRCTVIEFGCRPTDSSIEGRLVVTLEREAR